MLGEILLIIFIFYIIGFILAYGRIRAACTSTILYLRPHTPWIFAVGSWIMFLIGVWDWFYNRNLTSENFFEFRGERK